MPFGPRLLVAGHVIAASLMTSSTAPAVSLGIRSAIREPVAVRLAQRSLEYVVVAEPSSDGVPYGDPFETSPAALLGNGWRVQLKLRSPQTGFFYLLSEERAADGTSTFRRLSPLPSVHDGVAHYAADQPIVTEWYRLAERAGTETLWIIWSRGAVTHLDVVNGAVNDDDRGSIIDPARASAIWKLLVGTVSPPATASSRGGSRRVVQASGDVLVTRVDLNHQ